MKQLIFFLPLLTVLLFACGGQETDPIQDETDVDSVVVDSLEWYSQLIEKTPGKTEPYYIRAGYFIRQGDVASAQVDLETALAIDSTKLNVRNLYADILVSQLDLENGKYHYEYVLSKDSVNVEALMGLGKLYALLDNNAQAVYYLGLLLQQNPYYAEAYFMKGMIYRSDFYKTGRKESWDRAMSSYQTAVEQDPNYYSAYIEMGVMHDQIDDDVAIQYYNSALDIYPESIEAWYNIGMFHQKRGHIDDALLAYRTINRIDSTYADAYYNEGYVHMLMTEEVDSAIYYFEKAVIKDPEYFQAYNNLGLCYEKQNRLDQAKKYYQKAIQINPEYQLAKDNLNALQ